MELMRNQNIVLSAPREVVKDSLAQVLEKIDAESRANNENLRFIILTSSKPRKPSDFTADSLKSLKESKKIISMNVNDGFNLNICKVPQGTKTAEWICVLSDIFTDSFGLLEKGSEIIYSILNELYTEVNAFEEPEKSKDVSLKMIYDRLIEKSKAATSSDKVVFQRIAERFFYVANGELNESTCFGGASDNDINSICADNTVTMLELEEISTDMLSVINQYALFALFKSAKNNFDDKKKTVLVINDADKYITKKDYFKPFFDMASGFDLYYVFTADDFKNLPDFVIANTHQILQ